MQRDDDAKAPSQMVAELAHAHVEVEQFISEHKPDVIVYDVSMPYGSSWDLLDVIRSMPSLQSLHHLDYTRNRRKGDVPVAVEN
jgi:CheY-like chemotaxis protein